MSKIEVDYQTVENTVLPRLNYATSYLSSAYTTLKNSSIPTEYNSRSDLMKIINDIDSLKSSINKVSDFIVNSNKKLDNREDDNKNSIERIDNIILKERIKIIKNS